ncbi:MAG: DUF2520 domain-containing protein [Tannerellaceae bacterium]|jgi:predicted short-subunit dehydrogenase-like oxidoreductase (DUF2520 family)|nr:DUF2520 domain-containing protein [Tannerellaceae bacterium]
MKIVFIGAGNLACCVSMEMQRTGMTVAQIYNRTPEHAEALAKKLNCRWTSHLREIIPDADLYIFSLKDTALPKVIPHLKPNDGLWVHTAGSVPMNIFEGYARRYGVFYPLQTFSKKCRFALDGTPIFLEVSQPEDMKMLKKVANALSGNVQEAHSEKRRYIHLAAVFACNFTNHMYHLAAKLLEQQGMSYELLLPLIAETARKINDLPPLDAQTGPAVRFDQDVLEKQHQMLAGEPAMQVIYKLLSRNIYKEKIGNNE